MLHIAVCDDITIELIALAKQVENVLKEMKVKFEVKSFFKGRELLDSGESFDLLFLDIEMPDLSGMDLAKYMREQRKDGLIIFVTSHKEYVFEAYDVEAFQYLVKPVREETIKKVIKKAINKLENVEKHDFLMVSSKHCKKKILLKDILYIESLGRKVMVHLNSGVIEIYEQIGILEEKLSDKGFFRCHKCYLVNLGYIDSYNKTDICLENGEKIMLAKRRYSAFCQAFLIYMKKKGGIV